MNAVQVWVGKFLAIWNPVQIVLAVDGIVGAVREFQKTVSLWHNLAMLLIAASISIYIVYGIGWVLFAFY